jgi:hypothetical protein
MASESLDRVATVLVARLADMTEAQNGWPASAGWDTTRRGGAHWCWDHERDVFECHRLGASCDGEVVASPGDRTGEAALRKDRAAAHRREVERLIAAVLRDGRRLEQLVGLYSPRPASEAERRATLADNDREAGCRSCVRVEVSKGIARWEPVFRDDLCRWCYDWRRETGAVPSPAELDRHHRGERIRRPA